MKCKKGETIISMRYNTYSQYLKERYGEKVYKLPINLPISCPNRIHGDGCTFCADVGTGFESLENHLSVTQQLLKNKAYIEKKYNAHKFIAYFQNYTNTFLPIEQLLNALDEAASVDGIVEISISTRPDCISDSILSAIYKFYQKNGIHIHFELGLQTANYHTLDSICRGHSLAEFIDAVLRISGFPFTICTHIILNLPGDTLRDIIETAKIVSVLPIQIVKLHSLYIAKNSVMGEEYLNQNIKICSMEEYFERLEQFILHVRPDMIIERLFSRIPDEDSLFSNWGCSWWKLNNIITERFEQKDIHQGTLCNYMNGSKLSLLDK